MNFEIPIINRGFRDLNPLLAGWENCEPGHSFGPHVRDYHLVHYIQSGKGVLYNEDGAHPAGAGQIFLIRPGQVTTYTADEKDPWRYIWVGFDGDLADRLNRLDAWVLPYPEDTFIRLRYARDLSSTREEYVTGQLFAMLSLLLERQSAHPSYEQQAADYIRANYMRDLAIEDIARMVGLDRRYLSLIFKASAGMTMQDFLVRTRLDHAAQYLKQGEPVASAAMLSGYTDVFHFSKMFKKRFGMPPQQYKTAARKRQQNRNEGESS